LNTEVLSGKRLAGLIRQKAHDEARLLDNEGQRPVLAVVVATGDEATHWYVRSIERAAEREGIGCRIADLGNDATEQVLANVLSDLSADPSVNGIILQTPLPRGVRADDLVGLIAPEKDIDGANPLSLGRLAVGQPAFAPATARAVVEILDHFQIPVAGRNVVVVGRSAVVGKPLSLLLLEKDATVTICHSKSGPLETYTNPADVVVVATGRTGLLTGSHVSSRSTVPCRRCRRCQCHRGGGSTDTGSRRGRLCHHRTAASAHDGGCATAVALHRSSPLEGTAAEGCQGISTLRCTGGRFSPNGATLTDAPISFLAPSGKA
jgi:methylenetetrahydrofolate dehydrogenase (NADP+)/methenyltetrahydrofolate cyclohydrolase